MTAIINRIKSLSKIQLAAIALILVGLVIAVRFGMRTLSTFHELEYARANDFEAGNVDPALIRPWMTFRYIAVAYAVPQEYLFHATGIPMDRQTASKPLDALSDQFGFERGAGERDLISVLQKAIVAYRADPVPTGLTERGVRPWMTVQYIANSTGISAEEIFQKLGATLTDELANTQLERLADKLGYQGGDKELIKTLQQLVDERDPNSQGLDNHGPDGSAHDEHEQQP